LGTDVSGTRVWNVRKLFAASALCLLTIQREDTMNMQAKETYEATDLVKNGYLTAVKGTQDYQTKILEFTQTNTKAAFDFGQKLMGVKSPPEFIELCAEHTRKQFETLTEQAKEVLAIGQKLTLTTTEHHGMS
jgi:hypothetical protein